MFSITVSGLKKKRPGAYRSSRAHGIQICLRITFVVFWGAWTYSRTPQPYNMPGSKAFDNTCCCSVCYVILWTFPASPFCQRKCHSLRSMAFRRNHSGWYSASWFLLLWIERTIQLFPYYVNRFYKIIFIKVANSQYLQGFSGFRASTSRHNLAPILSAVTNEKSPAYGIRCWCLCKARFLCGYRLEQFAFFRLIRLAPK